jgi:hypothetical protein
MQIFDRNELVAINDFPRQLMLKVATLIPDISVNVLHQLTALRQRFEYFLRPDTRRCVRRIGFSAWAK